MSNKKNKNILFEDFYNQLEKLKIYDASGAVQSEVVVGTDKENGVEISR